MPLIDTGFRVLNLTENQEQKRNRNRLDMAAVMALQQANDIDQFFPMRERHTNKPSTRAQVRRQYFEDIR